jgi:hypothetical protein
MDQIITNSHPGERLEEIRLHFGFTQKEFTLLFEGNQGNYSNIISGKRPLPEIWIYKLKEKYVNLNEDWVFTGEGTMFNESDNKGKYDLLESVDYYKVGEPELLSEAMKKLSLPELQRMVLRLVYRVEELERRVRQLEGGH